MRRQADFVAEVPDVFSAEECDRLVGYIGTRGQAAGSIGKPDGSGVELNLDVRRARHTTLTCDPDSAWVYERLTRVLADCNTRHFGFDVHALEDLAIVEYREGDFYDWHLDVGRAARSRKLSVSVFLSAPGDYEGGALTFPGAEFTHVPRGSAIVFASFLLHGVQPVRRGRRVSLVGWLGGPPFR